MAVPLACEVHWHNQKEARLERENARLNTLVGELLLELKRAMRCWDGSAESPAHGPGRGRPAASEAAAQGRASMLGRSSSLGLSARCGTATGEQEMGSAFDAGASPASSAESAAEGQAHADGEHTATHQAQRGVGDRYDQGSDARGRLGLYRRGP